MKNSVRVALALSLVGLLSGRVGAEGAGGAGARRGMASLGYLGAPRGTSAGMADLHVGLVVRSKGVYGVTVELNAMGIASRGETRPRSANLGIGLTPYLRVHPLVGRAVSPFVEVGIGAIGYIEAYPTGGSRLNFSRQFGLGLRRSWRGHNVIVGTRWFHSSNQDMYGRARNPGLDALGVFVGVEGRF